MYNLGDGHGGPYISTNLEGHQSNLLFWWRADLVVGSGWTSTNSFRTRSSGLPSRCVSRCSCLPSRSCVTVTVHGGVTTKTGPPTVSDSESESESEQDSE